MIGQRIYYQLIAKLLVEVIIIFLSTQSSKREVSAFLEELKVFLKEDDFDIDTDFVLIRKNKKDDMVHSTTYTLLDLDYDIEDVVDKLKELTVEEYSETKIDKDDMNPPLLFVFGKNINKKLIYKVENKRKQEKARFMRVISLCKGYDEISICIIGDEKEEGQWKRVL